MGGNQHGDVVVKGVTIQSLQSITPVVSLVAMRQGAGIKFTEKRSTFDALGAQADKGITLEVEVRTTTGDMYLDGDAEDTGDAGGAHLCTRTACMRPREY